MAHVIKDATLGLRERNKQRTRTKLGDAAIELCMRQGYEQTTVDQIAAVVDVSPRTFSRYFATKDAVIMALVDEWLDRVGIELASQPAYLGEFEALYRAHVDAIAEVKAVAPNGLTADRLMCMVRIVASSQALRQAAGGFPAGPVNTALAARVEVDGDHPRLKLVTSVWLAIVMTVMEGVGSQSRCDVVTLDDVATLLSAAYAQFVDITTGAKKLT